MFSYSNYKQFINLLEKIDNSKALLDPYKHDAFEWMHNHHNTGLKVLEGDHIVLWDIDEYSFEDLDYLRKDIHNPLSYIHFNATQYGLLVDTDSPEELKKLTNLVRQNKHITFIWGFNVTVIEGLED